jgi:cysteinyl-tRNA synthetase
MSNNQIQLFDTKSRKLQIVESSDGKSLRIYSCGPTVYRDAHVGNMRTFIITNLHNLLRLVGLIDHFV